MRRSSLWLLAATLLGACDQLSQPVEPTRVHSIASQQDPAERTVVVRVEGSHTHFEPCFGENVLVEFNNQLVFFTRSDATGRLHERFMILDLSTTFTGLTSGTVWTLHGPFDMLTANGSPEGPGVFSFIRNGTLTSRGSAVNLLLRVRVHITANANGTITVDRETVEAVCK
jgi:hypothetical protein